MQLDVRIPMGLLFLLFGIILIVFGLTSNPSIYAKSMGENVNLTWGIVFAVFGSILLLLVRRSRKKS